MVARRRITFYVNDQPHTRWYGATVEHAVIAYDQQILTDIREGRQRNRHLLPEGSATAACIAVPARETEYRRKPLA